MKAIYTVFILSCIIHFLPAQNPIVTTLTEQFNGSGGVKLGPDGYLYVADFGAALSNPNGTQVWRIHPATGERELYASGLQGASGNDFDSQGNLFQSNIAGNRISKITPDGTVSTFTDVGISNPVGIVIDSVDNLYVCNCGSNTIRKVTPEGVSTLFSSGTIFSCPNGITIDHEGNLYVSNFNNSTVIKITPNGSPSFFASILGSNNGHLTFHSPDTMLYINSHGSSSIFKATLNGIVTRVAGTNQRGNTDGPALQATFSRPNGIALSVTGDTLWVNSSIPTVDNPSSNFYPLNPSLVRMITGLKNIPSNTDNHFSTEKLNLHISPNPANDYLQINMTIPTTGSLTINVFDLNGKIIYKNSLGEIQAGEIKKEIKLGDLPNGIYVASVIGEYFSLNKKVIISR